MKSLTFIAVAVLTAVNAATFKLIAPDAAKDVHVSISGQLTALSAQDPDVPYFIGEADIEEGGTYQYVVDGKTEEFNRTFDNGNSTLNEFFEREVTYATDIPELPTILTEGAWDKGSTSHPIWDSNYIPTIFINGVEEEMNDLIENIPKSTYKVKITFISPKDVTTIENCTLGLHKPGKKNNDAKQSWVWTLPEGEFYADRNWFKIRHQEEDPTQLREKLYADLARQMGTYANMANLVRFFINGEAMGTFNLLDDVIMYSYINAMFYNGNPPKQMGGLLDGASGADFNPQSGYDNFIPNVESPLHQDAISPFAEAFADVDFTNDEQVKAIGEYFDYDQFLRFMVIEFLTADWDGYWMEQTNDGAYVDLNNNKLYYLAQDFDGTFGVNIGYGREFVNVSYKEYPQRFPQGYLINKFLTNPTMQATFESYLKEATTTLFSTAVLLPYVTARHRFMYPDLVWDRSIVQRSPGRIFGWTAEQTTQNLYERVTASGEHSGGADWGLLQWVATKEQAVAQDLGFTANSVPVEEQNVVDELNKKPEPKKVEQSVASQSAAADKPAASSSTNKEIKQDDRIHAASIDKIKEASVQEEAINNTSDATLGKTLPQILSMVAIVGTIFALF
ncbi:coth protein-domain-containing protein [Gilbertella persicaria]|uniref:coth protein-domain-containing protein n=1 Tax=Gilbertella persicaria TaxID=101096 RepID=UPI002220DF19|nr:coth protein-domain-containing protein [Gilbertella persicaria]KAI8056549.1 coth protein-domain-containing protein [Gilbertella persicaria]